MDLGRSPDGGNSAAREAAPARSPDAILHDFCVIGGGIVGLATALELSRTHPGCSLLLLEKEQALGCHQSGHNSGVIHAGIYYKPKSLKARLCREGAIATKEFCEDNGIAYETRGKLVVASDEAEMHRLSALHANALENSIAVDAIDAAELRKREPNVVGRGALLVHATGIVDYRRICQAMGRRLTEAGAHIRLGTEVDSIEEGQAEVAVGAGGERWRARQLVVCAGLQSDRLARLSGMRIDHQIVPFRGEYYKVRPEKSRLVHHLIYPVPDPALPFLGIHLTPMIDGDLTVGPNAVLGFSRENYRKFSVDLRDVADYLRFKGFWKVAAGNWRSAADEFGDSISKRAYLKKCRKYCPDLSIGDLLPYRAGIRAQAVLGDGTLVHDFLMLHSRRILHVGNAPSPAATSAIPIGRMIAADIARMRQEAG